MRLGTAVLASALITGTTSCSLPDRRVPVGEPQSGSEWIIDDQALSNADPKDWLNYGRDQQGTHYSPLTQVNRVNVGELHLAWSRKLTGQSWRLEAVPLVGMGTLFATGPWSTVFALDAENGSVLWSWDPEVERDPGRGGPTMCCGPVNRGVALYRDRVYVGVLDGRLAALEAQTGRVVWERRTADPSMGYSITGAPRVAGGRIVIGNGGAEFGVRGYVSAYDPENGEMLWRFFTVPGDPSLGFESEAMSRAADTWHGRWWEGGGGGTVWDGITYDSDLDLVYIGVGNGSPWSRAERSPGGGDNLYLASIVALRAEDGSLAWYYQTTPGEEWDYTATQNMVLADLTIGERRRRVLMQAPKNGFFYVLDRETGEPISARAFAYVTWTHGINKLTGRPSVSASARYGVDAAWVAPGMRGAHSWPPMSWSPSTGLAYIPGEGNASIFRGVGGARAPDQPVVPTGRAPTREELGSPGYLLAWDPTTQSERWRVPYTSGGSGGVLSTGGDLVFTTPSDGWLEARDARSGAKLWEHYVGPGPATPVTYQIDERQYVAILSGGSVYAFALRDVL